MRKYRNIPTEVDGIKFASKKEAKRYSELKLLEKAGVITGLELQSRYPLKVGEHLVGHYVGDFHYWDNERARYVLEDVKGVKTPVYRLKKKLVLALWNIEIQEV